MSNTHKSFARLLALLLAVCLLTAALAGCEDDPSQTESTSGGEADIALQIGDATLAVTAYNTTPASDAAALLDRGYQRDGAYVYFADAAEGRVLVAVKSTLSGDTRTFAVQEILRAGEGESLYIPVNGFVLSLPEGMLPEGIKNGQTVTAEGYQPPAYERTEICAVLNEDRAYPRRVNLIDPVEAPDSGAGIVYITGRYKTEQTVPADSVALLLNSAYAAAFGLKGSPCGRYPSGGGQIVLYGAQPFDTAELPTLLDELWQTYMPVRFSEPIEYSLNLAADYVYLMLVHNRGVTKDYHTPVQIDRSAGIQLTVTWNEELPGVIEEILTGEQPVVSGRGFVTGLEPGEIKIFKWKR